MRQAQASERLFPLVHATPQGREADRAYAYRYHHRGDVVEKFTTNFDAAVRQVQTLRKQGFIVLTYSIFV